VLIGISVFVVVITTALYFVIKHLEGNIDAVDLSKETGPAPTKVVEKAINVLVMGDDTRKGQGPAIGGSTPGLSDTTILLHLSANRKFAYGVSLPRDAMVQRPECQTRNGVAAAGLTQFNAAYAIGGPACTIKMVQQLTGIRMDHYVVVKFKGFRSMVDAVGGVKICVPEQITDPQSNIYFKPGTYTVSGEEALNYVRVRHGVGDGSDLGRMKRQQAFIASLINKVVSAGTLTNPITLYKFLDAATKSIQTDPGFSSLSALVSIGRSLQHIGLDHIKFISVPYEPYPPDTNRVQWAPQASKLWNLILNDKPLTRDLQSGVVNASNTPGGKKKHQATAEEKQQADQVGLCS
jgi:LCP family protein required for cell wall assembly